MLDIVLALGVMIVFGVMLDAAASLAVGRGTPEQDYAARMRRRARVRRVAERRAAKRLERAMPSARVL